MKRPDTISFIFEDVTEQNVEQHHQTMIQLLDMFDLTSSILDHNEEYKQIIIQSLIDIYVSCFSMIEIYNELERYEYSKELYDKLKLIYITTMDRFQTEEDNEEIFNKLFKDLSDQFREYLND
jgi:hypothetical protein